MNAIIVDDEPDGIRTLQKLLEYNCPEVTVAATCTNASAAIEQLHLHQPDIMFLDIRMPGKSGFDLLEAIPVKNFEVIFVTAHNEYMLRALQLSAVDYLMKPVDEERLIEAVSRIKQRKNVKGQTVRTDILLHNLNKSALPVEMRICLPTQKGFSVIKLEEIVYCEAQRSYTLFRLTNNKTMVISKPLADYEKLLSDTIFLRIHKSCLINLMHVREYTRGEGGTVLMSNGMEIEVARRKKEQFLLKIKEVFRY